MAKTPSHPSGPIPANQPPSLLPANPAEPPDFVAASDDDATTSLTRTAARNVELAVAEARLEERRAAARTTAVLAATAGVVIVALVVALIVVVLNQPVGAGSAPTPTTSQTSAPSPTETPAGVATTASQTATALGAGQIAPPNADADQGWIEVRAANAAPDALIVDMHVDYQCPWCGIAETNFGQAFDQLAQRGDIVYRLHLRTFVGDLIIKNDSSLRAGMAAACADVVGSFLSYSQTVFDNQPQEGVGYTDQQLSTDFAAQAGITGANLTRFQSCYASGQTHDFVTNMEANNWNSTTINDNVVLTDPVRSTPSIFVDGAQLNLGSIMQTTSPYGSLIDNSADGLLAVLHQVAGR